MAQLAFSFLGGWQVSLEGQPLTGFESSKVRALLTYLALEPDRLHYREALAGLLWPAMSSADAHANLRQAIANLRKTISDSAARPPFLLITRTTIQFNRASDYKLDVADFTALLADCDQHPHRHIETCHACAARLQRATELYHGDFLEGFFLSGSSEFEEWELFQRESLRKFVLGALAHLAGYYERCASFDLAQRTHARQLELDPLCEEAHQHLMRSLARSGNRTAALAQYNTCRRILAEELGVEPSGETISLYEQIKTGKFEGYIPGAVLQLHNWPHSAKPLIGREAELAEIAELIAKPDCRLLTILGPGGMGKSHLALEAAAAQSRSFRDGAAFVSLAPLSSTEYLASTIADALSVPLSSPADPGEQLVHALRDSDLLIVLDNFEHLRQGTTLLSKILARAPGVQFIVTSRERLDVEGEWLFELRGLRYPESESPDQDIEKYSAVQLFLYSARRVRSNFALSEVDKTAIARICRMVGGMPLAIELSAAWVHVISPAEISAEIERGLGILSTTRQNVLERHRSLRVVFDNSWQLLTAEEQRAFRNLSVFRDPFERVAAERVAEVTLPLLSTLVNKTLVHWDHKWRYNMHELIGDYAREKLRESGDEDAIFARLADYILRLAETAEPGLRGPQQSTWLDRVDAHRNNLQAVLDWILNSGSDLNLEIGLRIASALAGFWWMRGLNKGRDWLAALLQHPKAAKHTAARAKALALAGDLAIVQEGNHPAARLMYEESLLIARKIGDKQGVAIALLGLGEIARAVGDVAGARSLKEQSLTIWQQLEEGWGIAWAFHELGDLAFDQVDLGQASSFYNQSLVIRREIGDQSGTAWLINNLGEIARYEGHYEQARELYEESLRLFRELGNKGGITCAITNLGFIALSQGNHPMARTFFEESLSQNSGNKGINAFCLIGLAGVSQNSVLAARLLGAADSIRDLNSTPTDRVDHDRIVAAVRAQLDEITFAAAWEAGRSMLLDQAIEVALQEERTKESW
ncbi:MAG: hypothetical protein C0401_12085 [Anaerolinea sp.]|nr:hypothetical protein [Anaerolinea sp.]